MYVQALNDPAPMPIRLAYGMPPCLFVAGPQSAMVTVWPLTFVRMANILSTRTCSFIRFNEAPYLLVMTACPRGTQYLLGSLPRLLEFEVSNQISGFRAQQILIHQSFSHGLIPFLRIKSEAAGEALYEMIGVTPSQP
jgi:hypothetical protein